MKLKSRIGISALIIASLLLVVGWCCLSVGYDVAIRAGLTDSAGNELGFGSPVTGELVVGLLRSAFAPESRKWWAESAYTVAAASMHLPALIVIWSARTPRWWHRLGFALQTVFFFPGLLGFLAWPFVGCAPWDGETIDDVPQVVMATPLWLLASWIYLLLSIPPKQATESFGKLNSIPT